MAINEEKLNDLIGRFVGDFGAALHAATVVIGDKLGLYAALAEHGPITGADLAAATGYDTRLVEEWLAAQFVSGYAEYHPATRAFRVSVAPRRDWPTPQRRRISSAPKRSPLRCGRTRSASARRPDPGPASADTNAAMTCSTAPRKLFRPGYLGNLVSAWIPSLDDVDAKLGAGAKVADIGCGHGASTILLGTAYPNVEIVGFDYHTESIE
jgi:hypothetical protein